MEANVKSEQDGIIFRVLVLIPSSAGTGLTTFLCVQYIFSYIWHSNCQFAKLAIYQPKCYNIVTGKLCVFVFSSDISAQLYFFTLNLGLLPLPVIDSLQSKIGVSTNIPEWGTMNRAQQVQSLESSTEIELIEPTEGEFFSWVAMLEAIRESSIAAILKAVSDQKPSHPPYWLGSDVFKEMVDHLTRRLDGFGVIRPYEEEKESRQARLTLSIPAQDGGSPLLWRLLVRHGEAIIVRNERRFLTNKCGPRSRLLVAENASRLPRLELGPEYNDPVARTRNCWLLVRTKRHVDELYVELSLVSPTELSPCGRYFRSLEYIPVYSGYPQRVQVDIAVQQDGPVTMPVIELIDDSVAHQGRD